MILGIPAGALAAAPVLGALLGRGGAAANGVSTWDERLAWTLAAGAGALPSGAMWAWMLGKMTAGGAPLSSTWFSGLAIHVAAGSLGAAATPRLDRSRSICAWAASFLLKWIQSPLATTGGIMAAGVVWALRRRLDFRAGMLFVETSPGDGALALGAVSWTGSLCFDPDGRIPYSLAHHESLHSRTVAATGELGFYLTYLTLGSCWAKVEGAPWNGLSRTGCGNPFEKAAHTFTGDPGVAVPASRPGRRS